MREAILRDIDGFCRDFGTGAAKVAEVLSGLSDSELADRSRPVHITASLLLVDGKDQALLVWHPGLSLYLQPGGHIESGEMPRECAARECYEETGVRLSKEEIDGLTLLDVEVHAIPARRDGTEPAHSHIDLLYLGRRPELPENLSPEALVHPISNFSDLKLSERLQKLRQRLVHSI